MREPLLLYVAPSAKFFLSHRAAIGRAAIEEGYRVTVACPLDADCQELAAQGFRHAAIALSRSRLSPAVEIRTLANLYRLFRGERPALAHLITAKAALHGGIAARLTRTPTVTAVTGLGYLFMQSGWRARAVQRALLLAYRFGLRRADNHFIFQNRDDRDTFRRFGLLDKGGELILPGSGVDLAALPVRPLPGGVPLALMPCRMLADKGVGEFLEAADILQRMGVIARFRLLGDPDPDNPTSLTADQLRSVEAAGSVEWRPFVANIGAALAEASIVVLPSYREGFPKTLIDAAAAGRAMVTTDVPGCRDAVIDGQTGVLCEPRNARSLALAMERLLTQPTLREAMGAAARRDAVSRFDIRSIVSAHLALYRTIRRDD
jgi:glycosyltransferase involved in cell wall biosynthesis